MVLPPEPFLMELKMAIYMDGGINWTWYAHVTVNADGTATVEREYRLHDHRDANHPKPVGVYRILERRDESGSLFAPRIAYAVMLGGDIFPLSCGDVSRWGSWPE